MKKMNNGNESTIESHWQFTAIQHYVRFNKISFDRFPISKPEKSQPNFPINVYSNWKY